MRGLPAGAELGGYLLGEELGRGGMGIVYGARDLNLGRRVALKVLDPGLARDPAFVVRFKAESRLAAAVEHPHVVPIYEAGEDDGMLFIAMRFVPGNDLRALVDRVGPLEPERAVNLLRQIAAGLDAVHAAGLIHRDVKPANILVTAPDDVAYLTDFGLARQAAAGSTAMTDSQTVIGTLDYMAPEQLRGEAVDARTDIYSLAALLFHLLEGRAPFADRGVEAKMYAHLNTAPPRISAPVPEALNRVIRRGMSKDRRRRFPSAGDLALAAMAAINGRAAARPPERAVATGEAAFSAPTATLPRHSPRRLPTRKLVVAAGLAMSLVALVSWGGASGGSSGSGGRGGSGERVPDLAASRAKAGSSSVPPLKAHPQVVIAAPPADPTCAPSPGGFVRITRVNRAVTCTAAFRLWLEYAARSPQEGTGYGLFLRLHHWSCLATMDAKYPQLGICTKNGNTTRFVVRAMPAPAGSPRRVYLEFCFATYLHPTKFVLGCDGSNVVSEVRWTSWGGAHVTGTGVHFHDDCSPDCVDGHYTRYPVDLTASRIERCIADGQWHYMSLAFRYRGPPPPGYRNGSVDATCE
jgi:tRNA A-37 threonylcarbamoyl transferase component Bud32